MAHDRNERSPVPVGPTAPGPRPVLLRRLLAEAVPPRPRGGPVPGAHRHDPLATHPRRGDRPRLRAAVRAVPRRSVDRRSGPPGTPPPDPSRRILSDEESGNPGVRARAAGAVRRDGAANAGGAHQPPVGGAEDRELRVGLWLRDPRHARRHARPPDREPAWGREDLHPGGDGGGAPSERRSEALDPAQPPVGPARTEPVPAPRAALPAVSGGSAPRHRPRAQRGAGAAPPGRPARTEAGKANNASSVRSCTTPSTGQATA